MQPIKRKMHFFKRILWLMIIFGFFLVSIAFLSQQVLQPSLQLSKTRDIDPQEIAALQTTLQLRLASEAVKALTQGKDEIRLVVSQEELDLLIRDQILSANAPPEVKFLGSKFTITGDQGNLLVSLRLLDKININAAATFAVGYHNGGLVFYIHRLKLGPLPLPEKTTSWLLARLNSQHEPREGVDTAAGGLQIFPAVNEIHFPLDFADDNMTLTKLSFVPGKGNAGVLAADFHLNTRQIQRQLLDEIIKAIPPNLIPKELLPYLQ
ncbi:MAG: hypothetical protein KGZ96_00480 [Clostridia bacterium]|nr:hypothetical protein [Clostridia bacterium]